MNSIANRAYSLAAVAVLAVVALVGARRCASGSGSLAYGGITSSGGDTIDVAIEYAPIVCYTYADTLGGLHYDMLRDIAERHALTLKFHPVTSFERSLPLVDGQVVDLLVADVPMTAEFRERYRYLEPVVVDCQVLVQLRDSTTGCGPIRGALALGGDTVWIAAGSSVESRLRNLGREIGDTIYVVEEEDYGPEQLAILTALGEVPRAVVSRRVAQAVAADYPQLDVSAEVSFNQFQSWIATPRHPALADSLDLWIAAYKQTPAYRALLRRYAIEAR